MRAQLEAVAAKVRGVRNEPPRVGLVLGSGLGGYANTIADRVAIQYQEIGMPVSRVQGHAGKLVLGRVAGMPVAAMQGRVHLYEGHEPNDVVFGARLMITLGAKILIITNAAGGIGEGYQPGDLMLIEDHLNLTARNCLMGENDDALGPRFPDMSDAYDARLRAIADQVARAQGFELQRGVYAGLLGPTYETPAEVRMLRTLGATAVGMSTVLETIAARHMGARVLGISCISNLAAGISKQPLSHDEVTETTDLVRDKFVSLVEGVLERIARGEADE